MKNCFVFIISLIMLLGWNGLSYAASGESKSTAVRFNGSVKNKCVLTTEATAEIGIADLVSKPDLLTTKPSEYSKGKPQRVSAKCSGNGKLGVGSPIAANANATKLSTSSKISETYQDQAGKGKLILSSATAAYILIPFNGTKKTYYIHMYVRNSPVGTPIKQASYLYKVVVSLTPM